MGRLEIVCDASLNPRSPGGFPCAIRAKGTDGKDYVAEVLDPPGFSRTGLDAEAVTDKFHAITSNRLLPGRARPDCRKRDGTRPQTERCPIVMAALAAANAACARKRPNSRQRRPKLVGLLLRDLSICRRAEAKQ